jgi:hypothetical protein
LPSAVQSAYAQAHTQHPEDTTTLRLLVSATINLFASA